MKFAEPHHAEIISTIYHAYVSYDGMMPNQDAPCYKGLSQCWNWRGATNNGYASMQVGDWSYVGHRVSYFLRNGDIPDGMVIRHKCDNKICTNPEHLEIGTPSDNAKDFQKRRNFFPRNVRGRRRNESIQQIVDGIMSHYKMAECIFIERSDQSKEAKQMRKEWEHLGNHLQQGLLDLVRKVDPTVDLKQVKWKPVHKPV